MTTENQTMNTQSPDDAALLRARAAAEQIANGSPAPAPAPKDLPKTSAAPAGAAKKASRLGGILAKKLATPRALLVYGPEGSGKSTFAAAAPGVILFDIENSTGDIHCSRYPFRDDRMGHVPRSLEEVRAGLLDLLENPHPYTRLVIDSLDRLENLVVRFCLKRDQPKSKVPLNSIEDYGFGKGVQIVLDEMRALLGLVDRLRNERGMDITIVGHAMIKKFANPVGEDYDRYRLKGNEKVADYVKEWANDVGFLHFEEGSAIAANSATKKAKGWSTGRRLIEFDRGPAWDAKARLPLPPTVEILSGDPWAPMQAAIDQAYSSTPETLSTLIAGQCERIGDAALTASVTAAVASAAGNVETLSKYLYNLRRREAMQATEATTNEENAQ